jgi:hypothetical protein
MYYSLFPYANAKHLLSLFYVLSTTTWLSLCASLSLNLKIPLEQMKHLRFLFASRFLVPRHQIADKKSKKGRFAQTAA